MSAPSNCRFCAAPLHRIFVDLGLSPLANHNLRPGEEAGERTYPLVTRVCDACLLVQADDSVPPEDIFSDYDYFSSVSDGWVAHARRYCEMTRDRFKLDSRSLAMEVASNDGYLLQHFVAVGIPVLGIEPAANVAKVAVAKGVPTDVCFFGVEAARRVASQHGKADLIAANNVLAHVPGTRDFVAGFAELLKPEGLATFEFPHVLNLIEQVQFDTIYHEHFFYLSLFTVERMMAAAGLRVFDAEELPTHGGSLRLFVCRDAASHGEAPRLADLRRKERAAGLHTPDGYAGFAARVAQVKRSFLDFVVQAEAGGRTIAAYGAAAKGNTFLNYCGVGAPRIREVYDRNEVKQGKLTPGTHIPIRPPEAIRELRPDYVLILPWNIADEVRRNLSFISEWGGRFVTAIPDIRIL
jgi:2-polyprenyl-3-methyl-5-hydroxy-6-metoxy-1,4-benzoquinol methylase